MQCHDSRICAPSLQLIDMALPKPSLKFFNLSMLAEYVAHVEINRPGKLNAFHHPMWDEMKAAFEYLSSNSDVRCVLLSGAGPRAFTAGTYIQTRSGSDQDHTHPLYQPMLKLTLLQALMSPPQPCLAPFKHKQQTPPEKPTPFANTSSTSSPPCLRFPRVRNPSLLSCTATAMD